MDPEYVKETTLNMIIVGDVAEQSITILKQYLARDDIFNSRLNVTFFTPDTALQKLTELQGFVFLVVDKTILDSLSNENSCKQKKQFLELVEQLNKNAKIYAVFCPFSTQELGNIYISKVCNIVMRNKKIDVPIFTLEFLYEKEITADFIANEVYDYLCMLLKLCMGDWFVGSHWFTLVEILKTKNVLAVKDRIVYVHTEHMIEQVTDLQNIIAKQKSLLNSKFLVNGFVNVHGDVTMHEMALITDTIVENLEKREDAIHCHYTFDKYCNNKRIHSPYSIEKLLFVDA